MIPPGLSVDGVKLRADMQRTASEPLLRELLDAAAQFCAARTGRTLSPASADDEDPTTVRVRARGSEIVRVPDARRLVSVVVDGDVLDLDDVEQYRRPNRVDVPVHLLELPAAGDVVVVTGWFGFDKIPGDLADGIYTDAARRASDANGGYPDAISGPEGTQYFRTLPARVQATYAAFDVRDRIGLG